MSETSVRCIAITQAGTRCKLHARPGAETCHIHAKQAARSADKKARPATAPGGAIVKVANETAPAKRRSAVQLELLVAELNELAAELRRMRPDFRPPPFSPTRMQALLKETVEKYTPDAQLELLRDLQNNLKETTAKDLVDPETWKGLWYILNYSIQYQATTLKESVLRRLAALPGVALAGDLRQNLAGTSPRDFLDLDTWRGLWYVLSYTAQLQAQQAVHRLRGDVTEESDEEPTDEEPTDEA